MMSVTSETPRPAVVPGCTDFLNFLRSMGNALSVPGMIVEEMGGMWARRWGAVREGHNR